MKNKILMITAALALMMAMAGIAAAYSAGATDGALLVKPGVPDSTTITSTSGSDEQVIDFTISGDTAGLKFYIDGTESLNDPNDYGLGVAKNWNLVVENNGAAQGDHAIQAIVTFAIPGVPGGTVTLVKPIDVTIDVWSVPEFPTVALPIAAVIGLVFLFSNKTKKEE